MFPWFPFQQSFLFLVTTTLVTYSHHLERHAVATPAALPSKMKVSSEEQQELHLVNVYILHDLCN